MIRHQTRSFEPGFASISAECTQTATTPGPATCRRRLRQEPSCCSCCWPAPRAPRRRAPSAARALPGLLPPRVLHRPPGRRTHCPRGPWQHGRHVALQLLRASARGDRLQKASPPSPTENDEPGSGRKSGRRRFAPGENLGRRRFAPGWAIPLIPCSRLQLPADHPALKLVPHARNRSR